MNELDVLTPYIEEFLRWKYTVHFVVGGGLFTFTYWMMYYHPEVMQTLMGSLSDIGPESIGVDLL